MDDQTFASDNESDLIWNEFIQSIYQPAQQDATNDGQVQEQKTLLLEDDDNDPEYDFLKDLQSIEFTPDNESDIIWNEFLQSIYQPLQQDSTSNDKNDGQVQEQKAFLLEDDDNDPEYDVVKDLQSIEFDDEDLDFDEMGEFLKNLDAGELPNLSFFQAANNSTEQASCSKVAPPSTKTQEVLGNGWNQEQLDLLKNQVTLSVQLLTTSIFLSAKDEAFDYIREGSKIMLQNWKKLCDNQDEQAHGVLNIANLEPSLRLIGHEQAHADNNKKTDFLKKKLSLHHRGIFFKHPDVFVYDWALPSSYYENIPLDNKFFKLSEDHLIAMGLRYTRCGVRLYYDISDNYLPVRNAKQIRNHVNNLKKSSKKTADDNPLLYYLRHFTLAPVVWNFDDPSKDSYAELKVPPKWYKQMLSNSAKDSPSSSSGEDSSTQSNKRSSQDSCDEQNPKRAKISDQDEDGEKTPEMACDMRQELDALIQQTVQGFQPLGEDPHSPNIIENTNIDHGSNGEDQDDDENDHEDEEEEDNGDYEESNAVAVPAEEDDFSLGEEVDEEGEEEEEEEANTDNEFYLKAMMEASWTAVSNRAKRTNTTNNNNNAILPTSSSMVCPPMKEAMRALQKESCMAIIENELASAHASDGYIPYQESLIDHYLDRARRILSFKDFAAFLELLSSLSSQTTETSDEADEAVSKVYKQTHAFLVNLRNQENRDTTKSVQELIDMLLLFLNCRQSSLIGEEDHFMVWKRIVTFIHNVEVHLTCLPDSNRERVQDSIKKMIRALNQLRQIQATNKEFNLKRRIKLVFSKLLPGHKMLMAQFQSLFADEPPPKHLFQDPNDFECFSIDETNVSAKDNSFEIVKIPSRDEDLRYGTSQCSCACHGQDKSESINLTSHCTSCGLRFSKSGRTYLPNNNPARKSQFTEYVPCDDNNSETKTHEDSKWTLEEDRILLKESRSILIEANIVELDAEVIEAVAKQLVETSTLAETRTCEQINLRLQQLIDLCLASSAQ